MALKRAVRLSAVLVACISVSAAASSSKSFLRAHMRVLAASTSASVELSNQLCGAEEYYCGGSDIYLEGTFAAATSATTPCQQDKELGVWFCGTVMLSNESYSALQSNRATCAASCMQSSVVQGAPSQYYWNATGWGACPVQCNGGLQTRTVSCVNSNDGSLAASSLCNNAARPDSYRPCGETPCQITNGGLTTDFTAFGGCEATCGSGLATRAGYCANPIGELADVSACASYSGLQLSRSCSSPAACTAVHWSAGAWGQCWSPVNNQTAFCDGGVANRTVVCVDGANQAVTSAQCQAAKLPMPATQHACNTAPCVGHTWQVGTFGPCNKTCGGGVANRTVTCMDQFGNAATPELCPGVQPADEIGCNLKPCNFCKNTNCAGQGTCKNNVCVCPQGYRGDYCEIAPACTGILDVAGNCCPHGIVDINGTCCSSATSTLDRYARCCESGALDACGKCDGSALLMDVQAVCCSSGVLDASGYCCVSGNLDECGVCDGGGSQCALHAIVDVQVSRPRALLTFGPTAFVSTFASFMATILKVNASLVAMSDYVLTPGSILSSSAANVGMHVDFQVQPPDSFSAKQDLRASVATVALQNAVGASASNELFILTAASTVERTAVCGNGVCEPGERTITGSGIGCAQDCPFDVQTCPGGNAKGKLCSGRGTCLTANGTCICHYGYQGLDCSQCAEGFIRYGTTCARYVKADLPLLDAASSKAASAFTTVLVIGIVLILIAVALLAIAVAIIIHQRRRLAEFRNITAGPGRRRPPSRRDLLRRGSERRAAAAQAEDGTSASGSMASQFAHQLRRKIPFSRAQAEAQAQKQPVEHPISRYMSSTVRAPVDVLDVARLHSSTSKAETAPLSSRSSQEMPGQSNATLHGPSRLGGADPSPLRTAMLHASQQQQQQPDVAADADSIKAEAPSDGVQQQHGGEIQLSTIAESSAEGSAESSPGKMAESAPLLSSISIQPKAVDLHEPGTSSSAGHAGLHRLKQSSGLPQDIFSDEELIPHLQAESHLQHTAPTAYSGLHTDSTGHHADQSSSQSRGDLPLPPQLRPLLIPRAGASQQQPQQQQQQPAGARQAARSQEGPGSTSAAASQRHPRVSDMDAAAILHRVQSRKEERPKRHRPKRMTGDHQEQGRRSDDSPQQLLNTARTLLHRFTRSEKVPDEEEVPLSPRQKPASLRRPAMHSGQRRQPSSANLTARSTAGTEMARLQAFNDGAQHAAEQAEQHESDDESDSPASGLLSRHRTISA